MNDEHERHAAGHEAPGHGFGSGESAGQTTAGAIAMPVPADGGGAIPFQFLEQGVTPLLYPRAYLAFIVVSTLDIAFTWIILSMGGTEVNPVAALVINHWGLNGAIAFKYALTVFVIVLCEAVGRHRGSSGRALSITAITLSSVPVVWSTFLLLGVTLGG